MHSGNIVNVTEKCTYNENLGDLYLTTIKKKERHVALLARRLAHELMLSRWPSSSGEWTLTSGSPGNQLG